MKTAVASIGATAVFLFDRRESGFFALYINASTVDK